MHQAVCSTTAAWLLKCITLPCMTLAIPAPAGIAFYLLLVTHQLHLPGYLERMAETQAPASISATRLFGSEKLDPNNPDVFASRLMNNGAFKRWGAA